MNFNIRHFFETAARGVIGLFFLLIGAFLLLLPWSDTFRITVTRFLWDEHFIMTCCGMIFILIGGTFVYSAFSRVGRRYIQISSNKTVIAVDENVIRHYTASYVHQRFPADNLCPEITIKKNAVRIVIDFPFIPESERKLFLEGIQKDINDIFHRLLGYKQEILLVAGFRKIS